ncbi:hypothetical protein [Bradyrhizobium lupini]|uniref:hypothetical protein n=1 Tax=Rhizobium lupini TaxID=136996 RepID=UPI0034C5E90F
MKVQPPKLASAENETAVVLEVPKNAVPVGTTAGLQLAAVLKSPVPGLVDQVEICGLRRRRTGQRRRQGSRSQPRCPLG